MIKKAIYIISTAILAIGPMAVFCAPDEPVDTVKLVEVTIEESKILVPAGFKSVDLDSGVIESYQTRSLSQLLQEQSGIYIKDYGNGGLATISLRGTDAAHTLVYWDGFELNSPMLGTFDFSLMPMTHFDALEMHFGASSLVDGSGGFGGAIHLNDADSRFEGMGFSGFQEYSSFETFAIGAEFRVGGERWGSSTAYYFKDSKNRFDFPDIYGNNEGENISVEAPFNIQSILQKVSYKINNKNILYGKIWYLSSHRVLPPGLNGAVNHEEQDDNYLRSVIGWRHLLRKGSFTTRFGYFDESIRYINQNAGLDNLNKARSYLAQTDLKYRLSTDLFLHVKGEFTHAKAASGGFDEHPQQTKTALYANLGWQPLDMLELSLIGRQELVDDGLSPFLPALGLKVHPFKSPDVEFRASIARNYRHPTLNHLYWNPGGNPELEPEKGMMLEGGAAYRWRPGGGKLSFTTDNTLYHSRIHDWIIWIPGEEGYWMARNVREVWTLGFEERIGINLKLNKWRFSNNLTYSYTHSENKKVLSSNDESRDKQLIYVPYHKLAYSADISYRGFSLGYGYHLVSKRFITTDNSTYLPSFMLHKLSIGKRFQLEEVDLSLAFEVDNLLDERYFNIVNRPMTGRAFSFKFVINH